MRDTTIARNYAETLLALATKAGDHAGWGTMIDSVAAAIRAEPKLRRFLESPRVDAGTKKRVLSKAFQDRMPRLMVRFLEVMIDNRRQMLVPQVATEYHALLDASVSRVHAEVTVSRPTSEAMVAQIAAQLTKAFNQEVVPHISVDPSILGGAVVRVGDVVMDGSVRRRLNKLRRQLAQ